MIDQSFKEMLKTMYVCLSCEILESIILLLSSMFSFDVLKKKKKKPRIVKLIEVDDYFLDIDIDMDIIIA